MADWTLSCGHSVHDGCNCSEPCFESCETQPRYCTQRRVEGRCRFYRTVSTPGPWISNDTPEDTCIVAERTDSCFTRTVAYVACDDINEREKIANAELIAYAPQMRELLKRAGAVAERELKQEIKNLLAQIP